MHLKSLTLKGFKSFASATTLRFEPGITCVVGPNGSGKSNVIDAIAWVLGEQGAKALRGGSMSDVIFAGTPNRPPLGRAEVTLTIDNSDGALPIDYTEVSVSRLMFRSGESEYSINGQTCRLLDVQELMGDSGIGRELHVVVGQGQLDSVLQARPEERRAFIEEAAGILKHRKRKEKALRKLDAMQANLMRLTDLTAEIRRQLTPLGKQAEVARKAGSIQANLRDARLRLLADELVTLRGALEAEVRDETAVIARRDVAEKALQQARLTEQRLEAELTADAPKLAQAQETYFQLTALRERLRGTSNLASERARNWGSEEIAAPGRDPDQLEFEASAIRTEEATVVAELEADRARLVDAAMRRTEAETSLAHHERLLSAATRAAAERREQLAKLAADVGSLRSRVQASEEEISRLTEAWDGAQLRAQTATQQLQALASSIDVAPSESLSKEYEQALGVATDAATALEELVAAEREAERQRTQWQARREVLELSLARKDGAGSLLAQPGLVSGTLAGAITVHAGAEAAIAAALGGAADAVLVASPGSAAEAIAHLRAQDLGRAGFVVGGSPAASAPVGDAPAGRWAVELVSVPAQYQAAVASLLHGIVVVDDLDTAARVAASGGRAVTLSGDLIGAGWAFGGSTSAPSLIEVQAALEEAQRELATSTSEVERLTIEVTVARAAVAPAREQAEQALAQLRASDAAAAAHAEQLGRLEAAARAAEGEAERLARSRADARTARDTDVVELEERERRWQSAQDSADERDEANPAERDRWASEVALIRQDEVEARLAVRTGEERVKAIGSRAESLERAAVAERESRERRAEQRERRALAAESARSIAAVASEALIKLDTSLAAAAALREESERIRVSRDGELLGIRSRIRTLTDEVDSLRDVAHRDEVARAEHRLRIEALEARSLEEWGVGADDLIAEYGPTVEVPGEADEHGENGPSTPYVREEQAKRAATAEKQMTLLGKVNPLALEEFEAMQERHQFLSEQVEDLKATRRDLLGIVKEVDERIDEVFRAAFEDTAREFEAIFPTLFPGGHGRLVLTEPDNILTTGIEVEATPAGKKVKRLSLLSGGERSLAAVAFLLAIFKARPSPFYILDEVEAALDDRNLGRLLTAVESLREKSQLIIVTHQKRTMEIADALYGVSMRDDGVTTVISQRLRDGSLQGASASA